MQPRKLTSGRWQARYTENGKTKAAGTFATKRDAQLAGIAAATSKPKKKSKDSGITLREFAETIALPVFKDALTENSYRNDERHFRLRLYPAFGDMALADITLEAINLWWIGQPMKVRKAAYFVLSKTLGLAVELGKLKKKPMLKKAGAKVHDDRPELTEEDAFRVLALCRPEIQTFLLLTFGGSMRIGEALGLSRFNVDLKKGVVRIEGQFEKAPGGQRYIPRTKNGDSRSVTLPSWALEPLRAHIAQRPLSEFLFVNQIGGRLGRDAVYLEWHRARAKLGLDNAHVHDLRATSATEFMRRSGDFPGVMARLGHRDVRSALGYQNVGSDRDAKLAAAWPEPHATSIAMHGGRT